MKPGIDPVRLYIVLLIFGVTLVIGVSYFLHQRQGSTPDASPSPQAQVDTPVSSSPQPQSVDNKKADDDAYQLYYWTLPLQISVYSTRHGYPQANAASWAAFINYHQTPPLDPYTGKPPVLTTTTPKIGEIQYISPGECTRGKPELTGSQTRKTFAYRALVAGKIMCYSNLSGYID